MCSTALTDWADKTLLFIYTYYIVLYYIISYYIIMLFIYILLLFNHSYVQIEPFSFVLIMRSYYVQTIINRKAIRSHLLKNWYQIHGECWRINQLLDNTIMISHWLSICSRCDMFVTICRKLLSSNLWIRLLLSCTDRTWRAMCVCVCVCD